MENGHRKSQDGLANKVSVKVAVIPTQHVNDYFVFAARRSFVSFHYSF